MQFDKMLRDNRQLAVADNSTHHRPLLGRCLAVLVTIGLLTLVFVSPMVLYSWGVHYEDSEGIFFEKVHPATWILLLAWLVSCFARGNHS